MAKKNQHAKQGFGVNDPQDAIHMGQGKRIRLEDVPADGTTGDKQVGNRAYNDARYQAKSGAAKTTRWLTPLIVQWSGTGLVYNHSQATFEIEGEEGIFTVQAGQKTLAVANPDNGRFDRFAANTDGQVIVIQGTPSPDPAEPSLPSPDTQIAGPVVFVGAGATEPSTGTGPTQIQNVTIYNENVAPEWANTYGGPGTADFNNTLNPFTGTRSINVSNVQNNSVLTFIAPADFNVADYDSIGMQLRLKELMLSGYNIRARFLNNAGVAVSNQVTLAINKNLFGAYQFIGIPMDQFTFTASTARRLELRWARGSGSVTYVGFFLDALVMQGGIIPSVVDGDVILQGQVQGSGKTGTPINVTVTEKVISDQTLQTDPLPSTAQHIVRLADGSLRRVDDGLIAANKVDKVAGKSLIDDTEIARLAGINDRFKGKYTSLVALETALPTATPGDYAQVDTGGSNPVVNYNWDAEDGWVIGSTVGGSISNTDELPEGSTNLYHTAARVLNTIITGVSFVTNRAIEATDSILVALGLLQKQITDALTSISGKQDTLVSGTNIKTVEGNSLIGAGNITILQTDYSPETGSVLSFALSSGKPRKYGFNGTPLTGNITFSITDANELIMVKACHNSGTEPTVTPPGGVTAIKEGGEYVVSVDNILYAICHKNDAGTVTKISYSWTQNQA